MWERSKNYSQWEIFPNGGATLSASRLPDGKWVGGVNAITSRPRWREEREAFTFQTREEAEEAARLALIERCEETIRILSSRVVAKGGRMS